MALDAEALRQLEQAREIRIVTTAEGRRYSTVIWVAVHEGDAYVRSVRGDRGRWYRRILDDPSVDLLAGESQIDALAVRADDSASVESASEGFRGKYPKGRSLDSMLAPETLGTTLRLEPRS